MAKVIGNTIATPMAVPDMAQTDERKADFVKNKKTSLLENDSGYVTEQYVEGVIVGGIGEAIQEIIKLQEEFIGKVEMIFICSGEVFPVKLKAGITWAEAIETEELKAIGMGFTLGDDGYVRCYISAFIKESDYAGEVSTSTFPTWCIKGTDKVKDGQMYETSGIYESEIYE